MTPASPLNRRIPGLDGMRAVSIVLVILGHLAGTRHYLSVEAGRSFGELGSLGVRVFFVISGFLITGLLLKEFRETETISLKAFYYRRTLRIFPAWSVFVAVVATASFFGILKLNDGDLWHALTYTTNYHYDRSWSVGHLWSLAIEEQFYLIWPSLIVLIGMNRALFCAAALVLVSPVLRVAIAMYWPNSIPTIGESFPTVADSIATGCVLAASVAWLDKRRHLATFMRSGWFFAVPAAAFLLNLSEGARLRFVLIDSVINICIALTIWRFASVTNGFASRLLNSRPMVSMGVLSYSLYLWQQLFLNRHSTAPMASFPLNVLLLVACAVASYRFVEKPFLSLRSRVMPGRIARQGAILPLG